MLQLGKQEGVLEHRAKWSQGTASVRKSKIGERTRGETKLKQGILDPEMLGWRSGMQRSI